MKRWLAMAAFAGPLLLSAALGARIAGVGPVWSTVVYAAAGLVCHQRPDRSFFTSGVQWPVCGRCAGLYIAAPLGVIAAFVLRRAWRDDRVRVWLALAALPTAVSWAAEHLLGMPQTNAVRAALALPLGAAVAFLLVRVAPE
ncbi:MAG: DUF2085 domain-containing protein [Acidobacteriota bacterium]